MGTKKTFKLNRVAVAAMMASAVAIPQFASAGSGFSDSTNPAYATGKIKSFYANSPSGLYPAGSCFDAAGNLVAPVAGGLCDSGPGLRKFVDTLPGLTLAGANNLGNYIPVAVADTISYVDADYYEIAVVEYAQKMHSDLPKPTTLRGYVQIDPLATDTSGASKSAGSKGVPLFQIDGITPVTISRPDGAGGFVQKPAYGFDKPFYLGPTIVANRGKPTRVKFYNALPVGRADATGRRNGDIFLPVDETLPGAGFGPEGKGVKYTQNRAEVHLHGGDNPWISDGTPHQWITPAGEADTANLVSVATEAKNAGIDPATFLRGPSAYNVPDMADPGPGAVTYYFPNGASARLMFYHDHSFGLTRLNVYAGEAAPYVLRDPVEAALLGTLPEIPLVIQDKTFVPANIGQQDSRWDTQFWGNSGDLWYSHVYETNQDPNSADATNPGGRWDWGPFFWPVFPSVFDLPTGENAIFDGGTGVHSKPVAARFSWTGDLSGLPAVSTLGLSEVTVTPEAFNDTPIVNGVAYPDLTVEPKAYRLRFLNAANDRMLNLGFYIAADGNTINPVDPFSGIAGVNNGAIGLCNGTEAATALCSEVKMVPFSGPNSPTTTTFSCPTTPTVGTGTKSAVITPANWTPVSDAYPISFPCAGGLFGTGWGSQDNRPGGVPDPSTAGPSIHLIGNEGGFLSNPQDIPSTPINYEYNKRSVTVLNTLEHGLFLGDAVRADTVVDFSAYAGKTLILYNDAPAPLPAGDPRLDYFTGGGDQTGAGGANNTVAGYGPNTRTVMRVKVAATLAGGGAVPGPFNFAGLDTAITAAVAAGEQMPPVVPQTAYQPSFGAAAPYDKDVFAHIFTGAIYLGNYNALNFTATSDMLYTKAPGQSGVKCTTPATCQAQLLAIKAAGPTLATKGSPVSAYLESKAIQELFDPTFGRMNATLGVELPFTSVSIQTTIPLGFIDPATESLSDGETQFWKITHNGVDSHPVHFHLVNLQVVNRVGWDGTIKAPYPEETGWKETVVMNPLEDVIVAVRSNKPALPFGLPHSYRAMDPSQPLGVSAGFTGIDPITGNPVTTTNQMADFGDEYVWHCHILGHEENDFMRPVVFDPKNKIPGAPAITALDNVTVPGHVKVLWTDPTPAGGADAAGVATLGNAANEIGFRVARAPVVGGVTQAYANVGTPKTYPQAGAFQPTVNTLANAVSFDDVPGAGDFEYTVYAVNTQGETASAPVRVAGPVATPTGLALTADLASSLSFKWTDNSTNETGFTLNWTSPTAASGSLVLPANSSTGTIAGLPANTQYSVTVSAQSATNVSAASNVVTATTAPLAVSGLASSSVLTGATSSVTLTWTNGNPNPATLTSVVISGTVGGAAIVPITQAGAGLGSVTLPNQPTATAYSLTVTVNGAGGSSTSTVTGSTAGVVLSAATGLGGQIANGNPLSAATFALNWTDNSRGESGYKVEVCRGSGTNCTAASATGALNQTNRWFTLPAASVALVAPAAATGGTYSATVGFAAQGQTNYYFRVSPLNGATAGAVSNISSPINLANAPTAPAAVSAVSNVAGGLTVSWTDTANNNVADSVQTALARELNAINLSNRGFGYVVAPNVTVVPAAVDAGNVVIPAIVTATINTNPFLPNFSRITALTINNPGVGYTVAPTLLIDAPTGGTAATRRQAVANATLTAQTWVTAAAATNGLSNLQTVTGLTSGKFYVFRVSATGAPGSNGNSATVPTTPTAPVLVK